jgi:hypothetical protein
MKILFFAPHSGIWVHAFPEAIVADALVHCGHEVVYASCGKLFEQYCVPMSAAGVKPGQSAELRQAVCDNCTRNDRLLREGFGFQGPTLRSLLAAQDLEKAEAILSAVTADSLYRLEYDGLPLGRIALYQLVIRKKRISLDLDSSDWDEYLVELRSTIYAWLAAQKLLDVHKPDRVIVYNGMYSVNRAACLLAEARGIPAMFLHAGVNLSNRLQTLMLGRGDTFSYYPRLVAQWPQFSEAPCTPDLLSQVTDHYLQLIEGRSVFVYSSGKSDRIFDLRRHFGVSPTQKVIVATLGSYDEEVAAEMIGARVYRKVPLFKTQVEWIAALTNFLKTRPDIFLIVRVHPREFPNRRDGRKSDHARLLEDILLHLPENAAVNWPADQISIYDLVDGTDVFLNSWSSTGKDMALLGIPTVIYSDEIPLYPVELNYFGDTLQSYFAAIERAVHDGWSAEKVRQSYRWAAYEFIRSTISIGDSFDEVENRKRSLLQKVVDRLRRFINRDFRQLRDLKRRRSPPLAVEQIADIVESAASTVVDRLKPSDLKRASVEEESSALRVELRRLAEALYPSPQQQAASRLFSRLTNPRLEICQRSNSSVLLP